MRPRNALVFATDLGVGPTKLALRVDAAGTLGAGDGSSEVNAVLDGP